MMMMMVVVLLLLSDAGVLPISITLLAIASSDRTGRDLCQSTVIISIVIVWYSSENMDEKSPQVYTSEYSGII